MQNESYLERLINKKLTKTEISTSTVFGVKASISEPSHVRLSIASQLYFEEYLLEIYNPIAIFPTDKAMTDFIGLEVVYINETEEEAQLKFDNGYELIVNLRDEVFYDPEAMCLKGPNDFWVVWN